MTHSEAAALFDRMHPGFFAQEYIRGIPEERIFEEMILPLKDLRMDSYDRELAENVAFGSYEGDMEALRDVVSQVNPAWAKHFQSAEKVFCGYVEGQVVSFCLVEDMGVHEIGGRRVRVGGPGCVGTLREYRRRGIGLTMVKLATALLKERGFDYSYIHYTGVGQWYARLGYRTCLRWTGSGILPEEE